MRRCSKDAARCYTALAGHVEHLPDAAVASSSATAAAAAAAPVVADNLTTQSAHQPNAMAGRPDGPWQPAISRRATSA
eukprot:15437236-Alexandrium_andersonii.AAC.1